MIFMILFNSLKMTQNYRFQTFAAVAHSFSLSFDIMTWQMLLGLFKWLIQSNILNPYYLRVKFHGEINDWFGLQIKWLVSIWISTLDLNWLNMYSPFKCQPQKMVKPTQTIRWQQSTNRFSVFNHFVGLMLQGLRSFELYSQIQIISFT